MRNIKSDKAQDQQPDPSTPQDILEMFEKYNLPPEDVPVEKPPEPKNKTILSTIRALLRALVRRLLPKRNVRK